MPYSFIPSNEIDRVAWLNNFSARLSEYASSFDLTPAEVARAQDDAKAYAHIVEYCDVMQNYYHMLVEYKRQLFRSPQWIPGVPLAPPPIPAPPPTVDAGIFNRAVHLAAKIRRHFAYTPSAGVDLGIALSGSSTDFDALCPELKITLDNGHPRLRWKKGKADGVAIYVDRDDGNGFVLITYTVKNFYVDTTELTGDAFSANWRYKIRYYVGDDEVGEFSPVLAVKVVRVE